MEATPLPLSSLLGIARLLRSLALRASPRPPDHPDLPALFSTAKELVNSIGFQSRNADTAWHLDALKNLSGLRIDAP